jgi:hypothetical protein
LEKEELLRECYECQINNSNLKSWAKKLEGDTDKIGFE